MEEKDTKTLELGELKSLTLLADTKNVFSIVPKKGAKVSVRLEITQIS